MKSQVGIGTIVPDAALDITSTNDGMLIPRIALVNTATATVTTPTTSEIVYNTATINDVTPGFYYWNGTIWIKILTGTNDDWKLTGNTGTTAGTNYIGTADAVDFRIKTQATDRWNISNTNNGQLQSYALGTAALPSYSWQTDPNTGLFSSGSDQVDFSTNGTARLRIPASDQVHALSLGTAALPFYSFSTDTDTGVLSPGADQIDFSTGATSRFRIPAANQVHALSLGTAALPFYSFSTDTNTGIYSPGADQVDFSTNATARFRIPAANQVHALSLGTAALPFYSFSTDTDTGILSPGADQIDFSTGTTARFRIPAANQVHALSLGTAALPFYSFSADTDSGILSPGADQIDFSTGATARFRIPAANQVHALSLGTAALPFYSFSADTNTGIFSSGADQVDFSTNATARFRIPAADQVHALSLGTAALPFYSFSADPNTGIFSPGADQVDFSTNGTARFRIPAANQVHALSLGTAALPFYSFSGDPDTGLWSAAANSLSLSTNGTEKWRIDANGNVGVSQTLPKGILDVEATDRGIVFPRVALTATNAQAPVINPQTGTIPAGTVVYNTATAGTSPNNVSPGLYYWNGTRWYALAGASGGLDWSLSGNAGTTAGTNFIGTTDAVDFLVYTNNTEKMRVRSDGSVGINSTGAATEKLKVSHTGAANDAINATNNDDSTGKGNAIWATNSNATGIAIIGSSGATPPNVLPTTGAGISGSHVDGYGIYGVCGNGTPNTAGHNGHAAGGFALDSDNAVGTNNNSAFAKLAGKDNVDPDGSGLATTSGVLYGGYFQGGVGAISYSYAGVLYNHNAAGTTGTSYKIIGNGVASTIIPDEKNIPRVMFCPEAPEVLFEDYGTGKLNNGEAYIALDKILAASMKIDEKHPLKVFIQLEGDCNGVFVTDKSSNGFRVKELQNGSSNVSFSWHIVGNRADSKDADGKVNSEFENLRLPIGPSRVKPDILATKNK
ncbi:hypothetical protein NAT51_17645 [Flavobacterium amniphilum]|nr:hypothetical protein [Flavobacterium amniphilum]